MLKKAGIVVAAATAGLLAVAPLAFAADRGDSDNGQRGGNAPSLSLYDIDLENDSAECAFINNAQADVTNDGTSNVFALLGAATGALTQTIAPVTTATQTVTQTASCNNLTFEDNRQDNSSAVTGSFNDD
ncbi:hypothetical protein [Pseudonocardia alaniniphila]|uniref:Uncharacterized protein n=1 Tax=Pseudonocardia alaniniphila TaxID=75291 RepID=A0ABS9THT0_9PSEU|nr:hypothetical protein [Pseudonocardia alaniniphila]MCH6168097.1 hypothetical protein [Pseudonocardia alaniniphila]